MLSVVTSTSIRSARESDRTNELNTNSSRDSGADHGTGYIISIIHRLGIVHIKHIP